MLLPSASPCLLICLPVAVSRHPAPQPEGEIDEGKEAEADTDGEEYGPGGRHAHVVDAKDREEVLAAHRRPRVRKHPRHRIRGRASPPGGREGDVESGELIVAKDDDRVLKEDDIFELNGVEKAGG